MSCIYEFRPGFEFDFDWERSKEVKETRNRLYA